MVVVNASLEVADSEVIVLDAILTKIAVERTETMAEMVTVAKTVEIMVIGEIFMATLGANFAITTNLG